MARRKTTTKKKAPAKKAKKEEPVVDEVTPPVESNEADVDESQTKPPVDESDAESPVVDGNDEDASSKNASDEEDSPVDDEAAPKREIDRNAVVHVRTAPNVHTAVLGNKAIFAGEVHQVPYRIYVSSFAPNKFAIKYPNETEYVVESKV